MWMHVITALVVIIRILPHRWLVLLIARSHNQSRATGRNIPGLWIDLSLQLSSFVDLLYVCM